MTLNGWGKGWGLQGLGNRVVEGVGFGSRERHWFHLSSNSNMSTLEKVKPSLLEGHTDKVKAVKD